MPINPSIPQHPRVGIAVFVCRSRQHPEFLLGLRKGSHGAGTFGLPGGHLELGEGFETCAARETLEETNLAIKDLEYITSTNSVWRNPETDAVEHHYITIFMRAYLENEGDEAELMEPEKCEKWIWRSFTQMRALEAREDVKLFLPLLNLMDDRPEVCARLENESS